MGASGAASDRRLDGRVAVITGGASGIGAATAERFRAAGARVVICDLDEAAGKEVAGRWPESVRFVAADVSDADSLEESSFVTGQAIVVDGGMCAEFDPRMRGQLAEEDILAGMGAEG